MKAIKLTGWVVLGCVAWAIGQSNAWAQGSLTPPGAPAPTMKTLAQVEPRTAITNTPFTISQSGSYYMTGNFSSTGHGIVITASGVTLDLMGFTLAGDRGSSDYGVFVDGATNAPVRDVVVRNGFIRNFGNGLRVEYCQDGRFDQLVVTTNSAEGVYFQGSYGQCNGNTLSDCTVSDNGDYGVVLDGSFGRCDGNTVSHCRIRENVERGIVLLECDNNRVEGNYVSAQTGGGSYGIYCSGTSKNLVLRNVCMGQVSNFSITANDTYGPIITDTGALPTTGAAAHPWANFSR